MAADARKVSRRFPSFRLSTDLASVEAAMEKLAHSESQQGKLSTDLVSVEATTEELLN